MIILPFFLGGGGGLDCYWWIPLINAASTLAPWNSSSKQGVSARLQRRLFLFLAEPWL